LEYFANINTGDTYKNYIKNLPKLKVLKVTATAFTPSFLYSNISQENLEVLEITTYNPLKLNFSFTNLKNLKLITNTCSEHNRESWGYLPNYEGLNKWRAIKYDRSIKYWRL
jgi:hypothetical protein